jgi:hypothetical protein
MIVGVVILVVVEIVTSYAGRQDLVRAQRTGCMRSTLERVFTARKDAADALRDIALVHAPTEPAKSAHALSATRAEEAAEGLLRLTGVSAGLTLPVIAGLDPLSADVRAERARFCARAFPQASLVSL